MKKEGGDLEGVGLLMKRDIGTLVSSKKKVKGIWKSRLELLMNEEEALVTSIGIEACRKKMSRERIIERAKVEKATAQIKCGNVVQLHILME